MTRSSSCCLDSFVSIINVTGRDAADDDVDDDEAFLEAAFPERSLTNFRKVF